MQPSSHTGTTPTPTTGPSLKPVPVQKVTGKGPQRRGYGWVWALVLLSGLGVGVYLYFRPATQQQVVLPATFRTATISNGRVESSLRLTGVTGARNFVSLTTPQ